MSRLALRGLELIPRALEPGNGEQDERNDQRDKRVGEVNMVGAGFKPRDEGREGCAPA